MYKVYYLDSAGDPGDFVAERQSYAEALGIARNHAWDREFGTGILHPCGCWEWGSEPDMIQRCRQHDLQPLLNRLREQVALAKQNWQEPWEEWFPEYGVIHVLGHTYPGGFNAAELTGREDPQRMVEKELERLEREHDLSDACREDLREILGNAAVQALAWADSNRLDAKRAAALAQKGLDLIGKGEYEAALIYLREAARLEEKYDASLDYRDALELAEELARKAEPSDKEENA